MHHLLALDIREGTYKFMLWTVPVSKIRLVRLSTWNIEMVNSLVQTVHGAPEQEIRRDVQSHSIEQVRHVDSLAGSRHLGHHSLGPTLEDLQVRNLLLDEHGPDQAPAVLPQLPIRGEDAVAEERAPGLVKLLSLAKVGKLGRQDGLDMLGLPGEDVSRVAKDTQFDAVRTLWRGVPVETVVVLEQAVLRLFDAAVYEPRQAGQRVQGEDVGPDASHLADAVVGIATG